MATPAPFRAATLSLPLFLAPAFAESRASIRPSFFRSFSSSPHLAKRKKTKDANRKRGVSAIRSTGPRVPLTASFHYKELPTPVPDEERPLDQWPVREDHGLYGFFEDKKTTMPGEEEEAHGKAVYPSIMRMKWD